MDNKALVITTLLLVGCQAETETPKANFDAPASPETAVYHVRTQQQPSIQNLPISIASPQQIRTQIQPVQTSNNQKTIYQCKLPDGKTLFSDKICDNVEQTIPVVEFKSRKIAPIPAYTSKPVAQASTPKQTDNTYQKPSAYEINKRYDNLARKINAIYDRKDKAQLNQALLILERDRNRALSMRAERKQSYDINKRYDNMVREASFQNKSKALAYQLLKIEQMRNHELYRDNVSF